MTKKVKKTPSSSLPHHKPPHFDFDTIWKQRTLAVPLIIILIFTALIYARTLQNGILTWDDDWHVTENKDVHSFDVKNIFKSYYGNMYHPLTTLTFALEYRLFGLNPAIYHATNVLFHLANVILVFLLVFRLSKRKEVAFIAAGLFAIHPMHVESIAWITERKDVVYAFFYLYALNCYVRFIQKEGKNYYWLAVLFFILSLFSKTTAITFPVVLLFIDIYYRRPIKARIIFEKLPLFVISIVFGIVAIRSQSESVAMGFNLMDRFFSALYSICYYIFHLFAPINLSALHLMPKKINGLLPLEYYLAVIPIVILVFLGFKKGILQREFIFGSLFFLVTISLTIHIIPIGMAIVSERYTYIPYIGLYYIIGQLYFFTVDRYKDLLQTKKKLILIAASLIAVLMGYLTYQRVGVWKNTLDLFTDASSKAHNVKEARYIQAIGYEHEATTRNKAMKYSEAIGWYDKAIALDPGRAELYSNRGIAKHCLNDFEGAMNDYTTAIKINPSLSKAYPNRAALYLRQNKKAEACADLRRAYNLGIRNVYEIMQIDCP